MILMLLPDPVSLRGAVAGKVAEQQQMIGRTVLAWTLGFCAGV